LAFRESLLLWALLMATPVSFWRRRAAAALLLLPYFAWVSFAALLTWAIWRANPHLLV